jgi:hypothetical protein
VGFEGNRREAKEGKMKDLGFLLTIIAVLLFLIFWKLSAISARLKERFPTEKEQDFEWSQKDPIGHSEAHKDDGKKTK